MTDKTVTEQVRLLEKDRDNWKREAEKRGKRMSKIISQLDRLRVDCEAAESERDRLRAGQDRWDDDFPCCSYGAAPTGYAADDHQDAEVTQWHAPQPEPRRLTVHDLNVAPVGSVLVAHEGAAVKRPYGNWDVTGGAPASSKRLIALGWSTARLETGGRDE